MKVIILCGGQGTRLKEETEYKPKPMIYIGNKPIIWHIMKIYAAYGFNEFIFALGYKANYIKEYFLNQKAFTSDFTLHTKKLRTTFHSESRKEVDDFKITFVDTGIETLPGERILRCESYIPKSDAHFMVTYGDGVSNIDIKQLLTHHTKKKCIGTITGTHPRSKYGLISVDSEGMVDKFIEKPVLQDWVNGGFMVFNREFFSYLKPGEMEHEGLKRIGAIKKLSMYRHEGFWFAIDTYKELEELNAIWRQKSPPWKIWK